MTPAGLDENRAVQLLIVSDGEVVKVGSGYLAGDDVVLTAAHLVSGADAVTVRRVTGWRQVRETVGTTVWSDAGTDIAVVRLDGGGDIVPAAGVPPLRYGRVEGEADCEALGFPRFKLRQDASAAEGDADAGKYRDTHHAIGKIAPLSNRRQGTLEITVPPPEHDASPRHSPWEGMSGAAVFAGGALVGVVSEHHTSDGLRRLAARPVSHWYGLGLEHLDGLRALLGLPEEDRLLTVSGALKRPFLRTSAGVKWSAATTVAAAVTFGSMYVVGFAGRRSGPPLTVTVQTRESVVDTGAWFIPGKLPLAPANKSLTSDDLTGILAKRSDKVDTYETSALVTVEGGSHSVTITGMHLKILSRTALTDGGTLLVAPPEGEDKVVKIGFDLDEAVPVARRADPGAKDNGERYFDGWTDSTNPGEMMSFGITFQTVESDVSYDLVLEEVVDGKVAEQVVANGSQPFHTRGFAPAYDQVVAWNLNEVGLAGASRVKAMDAMCGVPCATIMKVVTAGTK